MGGTKRLLEEQLEENAAPFYKAIADKLKGCPIDIHVDELNWEVNLDMSNDGLIYGHWVNFDTDTDSIVLEHLGAEDGSLYFTESYAEDNRYDDYLAELQWESESEEHFKIFRETIKNIELLCKLEVPKESQFSLDVMLFMHVVSAMERLLQSNFLHEVSTSEEYKKRFVECDKELSERPMTLGKFYEVRRKLDTTINNRIGEMIFHNVQIVAGLYAKVFTLQLGNVSWLRKAVLKRHDCAHRAGYTKKGERVTFDETEIQELIDSCIDLAESIESHFRNSQEDPPL